MKKSVPVKSPSLQRRSVRQSRSFASREYHSCGRFHFLQQRKEHMFWIFSLVLKILIQNINRWHPEVGKTAAPNLRNIRPQVAKLLSWFTPINMSTLINHDFFKINLSTLINKSTLINMSTLINLDQPEHLDQPEYLSQPWSTWAPWPTRAPCSTWTPWSPLSPWSTWTHADWTCKPELHTEQGVSLSVWKIWFINEL